MAGMNRLKSVVLCHCSINIQTHCHLSMFLCSGNRFLHDGERISAVKSVNIQPSDQDAVFLQHGVLSKEFVELMGHCNTIQAQYRDRNVERIQRQLKISEYMRNRVGSCRLRQYNVCHMTPASSVLRKNLLD